MEVRLRNIFKPFAYFSAVILSRLGTSVRALTTLCYLAAALCAAVFYFLSEVPYSDELQLLSILCVFALGFADEVAREFENVNRRAGGQRFLDRYADVAVMSGALYYLSKQLYRYDVGALILYPVQNHYLALGAAMLLGMIFLEYAYSRTARSYTAGFNAMSERMFILAAFLTAGYVRRSFDEFLLTGLFILCFFVYAALVHAVFPDIGESLLRAGAGTLRALAYFSKIFSHPYRALAQGFRSFKPLLNWRPAAVETPREIALPADEAQHVYNFTAVAVDAKSEQPVKALVSMTSKEHGKVEEKYTDAFGRADFSQMPEGQYKVAITSEGFRSEEYDRYMSVDGGEVFKLHRPSAELSIVVNDGEKAAPIPGARVALNIGGGEYSKSTDNLGVAYFENLPGTEGSIRVEAEGYKGKGGSVDIRKENILSFNLSRKKKPGELSSPALIKYASSSRLADVIIGMAKAHIEKNMQVTIISASSRSDSYRGLEKAQVIEFESITQENFDAIFDNIAAGGMLIFETLSELIQRIGFESSYKFIAETIGYLADRKASFMCFVNIDKSGEHARKFEELFTVAAAADGSSLRVD